MAIGVSVDAQDNIWMVHRSSATLHNNEKGAELNPPIAACCRGAPPVLAFNQDGDTIRAWGGPGEGYEWPELMHGIFADHKGNIWLGGNGAKDAQILKFTQDGKFVLQSGHQGKNAGSNDPENFGRVAQIFVDPKTNEGYVADGYRNRRVAVVDAETGKIKRFWGAYGKKPDDAAHGPYDPSGAPAQQYRSPVHCVALSNDDLLYVCDRQSDRVQIFKPDGTFIKEVFFAKNTLASGSTWEIAFSRDPEQRFIYLTDGQNERVRIVQRDTMTELASFGRGGRQPGTVLRRAQHRRRFQRQHLHDRNLRGETHSEVRLQGPRQRAGRRPGLALAEARKLTTRHDGGRLSTPAAATRRLDQAVQRHRPACRSRRRCRSNHCAITPAIAALFFSIIIMWPLPRTPTSARRMSVLRTPACSR